jgi:hypothetical protein
MIADRTIDRPRCSEKMDMFTQWHIAAIRMSLSPGGAAS